MRTNSTPFKLLCTVALLSSIFCFDVHAEDQKATPAASSGKKESAGKKNSVNQLKAALKKANDELSAAQAKDAEQSRRIAQLEEQLKNANPTPVAVAGTPAVAAGAPVADNAQLQQELKSSKTRINELEEQLFVATDGKGVKGKEVAEELPEGTYPWTENMKRLPVGVLFPKTATIPKGDVYARFSHTSQNQTFATGGKGDPFNDLLGLESGVKVGILFGYGIATNWDVMVQRTNGRKYTPVEPSDKEHTFDLWDVMTKYKFLDENKQGIDASLSLGGTYFWQNYGGGSWAGNTALLFEKSFWRFRAGSGLLYTSMSAYEKARSNTGVDLTKPYKGDENYDDDGNLLSRPENHTMAIPVSLSFALTKSQQLFSEVAFPGACQFRRDFLKGTVCPISRCG